MASGTALMLTALRLTAVSHYNLSSVLGILGSAPTSTVILGTVVMFLPYAVVMAVTAWLSTLCMKKMLMLKVEQSACM